MQSRRWLMATLAGGLVALPFAARAQRFDPDDFDRPPPRRPRPPDFDDGFRPPPPPDDGGFRRPPPGDFGDGGPPLVCRTEEGTCGSRGPQIYRRRCFCDFGDGPVRGRLKP